MKNETFCKLHSDYWGFDDTDVNGIGEELLDGTEQKQFLEYCIITMIPDIEMMKNKAIEKMPYSSNLVEYSNGFIEGQKFIIDYLKNY